MDSISKQRFLELYEAAEGARLYAPFSKFGVRAAVRGLGSGLQNWIFNGANVEIGPNSAVCAEVNAINNMINTAGPRTIVDILILGPGDEICMPCGHCRDAIKASSGVKTKIIAANQKMEKRIFGLADLLPDYKGYFGIQPISLAGDNLRLSPIFHAAAQVRNNGYMPYSRPDDKKTLAVRIGVAVQMDNDFIATGVDVEIANYKGISGVASALAEVVSKGMLGKIRDIVFVMPNSQLRPISGADRQLILELADKHTRIHVMTESGLLVKTYTMDELLPYSFGPSNLKLDRA